MPKTLIYLLSITLMAIVFLAGNAVYADRIPADEVEIVTPVYSPEPENFTPRFGEYVYAVSWQGIPAGTLEIRLAQSGNDYRIEASARTNKFIDFFYKLRFNTEAFVSAATLHPRSSVYDSRQNKRRERTKIEFLPGGEIHSTHEDHRGTVKELRFQPNNLTLDPFSAVFLALSLTWEVGDTRVFDTFTGKSRYLVELTAVEKTTISVKGSDREAVVISPRVKNLTRKDPSEGEDKLRGARIYVSTDPSREILRISGDVFIGTVDTEMISFLPSETGSALESSPNDVPGANISEKIP
ncbi:MAG: DUF3108 domain-containing protein [Desulfosalsimonadaceae bacterium]